MAFDIFIAPHERREALAAYKDWLSPEQVTEIEDADEAATIRLQRNTLRRETELFIILDEDR